MHLPIQFRRVPAVLSDTVAPAAKDEFDRAMAVRRAFNFPGWPDPYMNDIVRAFRIARGKRTYVEVGSRDKGNVAWLAAHVLADDATIIDIDLEAFPDQEAKLRTYLKPRQTYHSITGDCLAPAVLAKVQAAMLGGKADLIFCDTAHTFQHCLTEFDAYFPLVKTGGAMFIHDCYFEGTADQKGKSQALQQLDRVVPVYVVFADEPTHRHLLRETTKPVWGGCAIVPKTVETFGSGRD